MLGLIDTAGDVLIIVLIFRWVVESFIVEWQATPWFLKIRNITEPLLAFCRKSVPPVQGIDLSYIVAILGVKVAVWAIGKIL